MYQGFPLLVESQLKRIPTFGVKKKIFKVGKIKRT